MVGCRRHRPLSNTHDALAGLASTRTTTDYETETIRALASLPATLGQEAIMTGPVASTWATGDHETTAVDTATTDDGETARSAVG